MIYEQMIDDKRDTDTPILVTYNNGTEQLILHRNEKKEKTRDAAKFIIVELCKFVLYIIESVFIGMEGLKK